MVNSVEDLKEYLIAYTFPLDGKWFSLRFDSTEYLERIDKEITMQAFEESVTNIRSRLLNLYNGKDQHK